MKSKKIALIGVFIALAFIFSYIEAIFPIQIPIPGIKIGLANLVVIVSLYLLGENTAFGLAILRIVLVGFTFGNMSTLIYSLAGGLLSYIVMLFAKRLNLFSCVGVSILGGVFHNIGQIIVAVLIIESSSLFAYLPILFLCGMIAGLIIGILGAAIIKRVSVYFSL